MYFLVLAYNSWTHAVFVRWRCISFWVQGLK